MLNWGANCRDVARYVSTSARCVPWRGGGSARSFRSRRNPQRSNYILNITRRKSICYKKIFYNVTKSGLCATYVK